MGVRWLWLAQGEDGVDGLHGAGAGMDQSASVSDCIALPLDRPHRLTIAGIHARVQVVVHTHYLPRNWRGRAHTAEVQAAFSSLFQYKVGLEQLG